MLEFSIKKDVQGNDYLETPITGKALLTISQLNKGTAFTESERLEFGLLGKLPGRIETLDEQIKRCYVQYRAFDEQINRNVYLNNLLNTNQVVFYRLIQEHIEEMLPTIYTPIVGNAVKSFNQKFSQPRGLYISYHDRDHIEEILKNRTNAEIKLIVVSDGEGVLGIGDQGIGAMAIPVAKLMVYTAFGGIDPNHTLPILLDAGTNNEELLNDPLYLGWRHPRLTGSGYAEFIEKFVTAVQKTFPHVFLHWEDFGRLNAHRNLIQYRDTMCTFNDDIQGTGVVALSAVLSAVQHTHSHLDAQRIVVFGAGTAGAGVTDSLCAALKRLGIKDEDARQHFWLIDRDGLLTEYHQHPTEAQKPYLRSEKEIAQWKVVNKKNISLLETIQNVKPTILIGASAVPGAFTEEVIRTMAQYVERPIIFPLSNPTEKCEATPEDILNWSNGKALIAAGSPFPPVKYQGKMIPINQCNNYLAFPGIGLGVISIQAKRLTDDMLWAASEALSHFEKEDSQRLLPTIQNATDASRKIAIAVATTAEKQGLAGATGYSSIEMLIDSHVWKPKYLPYKLKR